MSSAEASGCFYLISRGTHLVCPDDQRDSDLPAPLSFLLLYANESDSDLMDLKKMLAFAVITFLICKTGKSHNFLNFIF